MTNEQIINLCKNKEQELLNESFGKLVDEASFNRPETIEHYTPELPMIIAMKYRDFLEKLWEDAAPDELKGSPFILDEQRLLRLMTDDDREGVDSAYKHAIRQNIWEKVTKTNYKDVTYYKGLLEAYTKDILMVMRNDYLEEVTGVYIKNKTFENV